MALNPHVSTALRNSMLDAVSSQFNSGYLRIYAGTQPANANTAMSGETLLAELIFNATGFAAASGGQMVANAITADSSANNTGTASFYRCFASDGTTALIDGSVGTSTADMVINTTSIVAGATISTNNFTIAIPA